MICELGVAHIQLNILFGCQIPTRWIVEEVARCKQEPSSMSLHYSFWTIKPLLVLYHQPATSSSAYFQSYKARAQPCHCFPVQFISVKRDLLVGWQRKKPGNCTVRSQFIKTPVATSFNIKVLHSSATRNNKSVVAKGIFCFQSTHIFMISSCVQQRKKA